MKKNLYYMVVILIGFLILEISSRFLFKDEFKNYDRRVMLYSEDSTFKNFKDIFFYKKNSSFKSMAIYKDKLSNEFIKEYEYDLRSNNSGLIQSQDIIKNKKSIFILGASETKGQGSKPWFYDLEKYNTQENIQFVNIGMIGTGPSQQNKLFRKIKDEYSLKVDKIIIIFSRGYFSRAVWNFNDQQLRCLKKQDSCIGTESIYGFNFKNSDPFIFAGNIINSRMNNLNSFSESIKSGNYFQALKEIAKKSYFIKKLYLVFKIYEANNLQSENNYNTLINLKNEFSDKLYLIHMMSKEEAKNNSLSESSMVTLKKLKENKLMKNYHFCKIPHNGFHKNDSHANKIGYTFLRKCVERLLNEK